MNIRIRNTMYWLCSILLITLAACSPSAVQLPETGSTQTPLPTTPVSPYPQPSQEHSGTPVDSGSSFTLVGTHWVLASLTAAGTEIPLPAGTEVTLNFEAKGQASGSSGCNSFGAQYSIEGNTITFSQIVSTMMACTDSGTMNLEQRYLQALKLTGTFERTDKGLTISFDNNAGSLNFIPAENGTTPTPISDRLCSIVSDASNSEWKVCRNPQVGFEVQFPAEAVLTDNTASSARIDLPFTPGTNLTEKYLQIDAQENKTPCSSPLAEGREPGTVPTENVQINGLEFTKQSGQGAATGNRYDWTAYSISQQSVCLSLSFVLHSFDPQLVPTPPPEFDQAAESAIFPEIMQSFAWLNQAATPTPGSGQPTPTPQRIDFAAGATSATESGSLTASGSALYVLRALQGQTMTVNLSFTRGRAILVVYGADGTVLQTDHAEASQFEGGLPSTQDYYILVEGRPDGPTDYKLQVTIPPA